MIVVKATVNLTTTRVGADTYELQDMTMKRLKKQAGIDNSTALKLTGLTWATAGGVILVLLLVNAIFSSGIFSI